MLQMQGLGFSVGWLARLVELLPLLLIACLGTLNLRQTARWLLTAAFLIVVLSLYDDWRTFSADAAWPLFQGTTSRLPTVLDLALPAGLFIGHCLLQARATLVRAGTWAETWAGTWSATYYRHCWDTSWRLLLQSVLSVLFVLLLYGLLHLGATLFTMVQLTPLANLLIHDSFVTPILAGSFAFAFHVSALRPEIVEPARNVLLTILARLLPPATALLGIFLLALPWTGLQGLWDTKHATPILLTSAVALVLLINAAWQDAQAPAGLHGVLRWSVRLASLWLLVLIPLAAQALGLRVADHGWSSSRVSVAAAMLPMACYAIGYAWAAPRSTTVWMAILGRVNIANAYLILLLLLALHSPLADPNRMAVNSQLARLEAGLVTAEQFDYNYLAWHSQRYGREALQQLSVTGIGPEPEQVRKAAEQALNVKTDPIKEPTAAQPVQSTSQHLRERLHAQPNGTPLPPSFLEQNWKDSPTASDLPSCLLYQGHHCDVYQRPVNAIYRKPQMLLVDQLQNSWASLFEQDGHGDWKLLGSVPQFPNRCASQQHLTEGNWQLETSQAQDLVIGTQHFVLQRPVPAEVCATGTPSERAPQ